MQTATLTWDVNPALDLAGYNVYRQVNPLGGPVGIFMKLAPPAGAPIPPPFGLALPVLVLKGTQTYVDPTVPAIDADIIYNVTAVDTAGNESLHSANADKVINVVPPPAPTGLVVTIQ